MLSGSDFSNNSTGSLSLVRILSSNFMVADVFFGVVELLEEFSDDSGVILGYVGGFASVSFRL